MISQQQVARRGLNALATAGRHLKAIDMDSVEIHGYDRANIARAWIELAKEYRSYIWDIGMVAVQQESEEPAGDTPGEE